MCRFSYAREEPAGGPLLKGRRKCAETARGESWMTAVAEVSMTATVRSEIPDAATPIGALPVLQSPKQLHCRDSPSLSLP